MQTLLSPLNSFSVGPQLEINKFSSILFLCVCVFVVYVTPNQNILEQAERTMTAGQIIIGY